MAAEYPAHEGLQVAPDSSAAPEVHQPESGPEVVPAKKYMQEVYYHQQPPPPDGNKGKRLCGIGRGIAFLVFGLIALVVIGAVVGGAVGGIAARNSSSTTTSASASASATTTTSQTASTTTTSSTLTSTSAVPTSGVVPLNCPAINNTQFTATSASGTQATFELYCLVDLAGPGSQQISVSREGSLDNCVDSCVTYNDAGHSPQCQGLTFDANLTAYNNVNCFLKTNITGKAPYTLDNYQASAILLD